MSISTKTILPRDACRNERGRRMFKWTPVRPEMGQNDSILNIHAHVYDDKNVLVKIID